MNWVAKTTKFIRSKHIWRKATFNEMSALYISRIMRILAINLSSVFIYAFLLKQGQSLEQVIFFLIVTLFFQSLFIPLAAVLVARYGAKKSLLIGNLLYIPVLVVFSFVDFNNHLISLLIAIVQGLAVAVYLLAYNIIFSEVKNSRNSGSEIGFMMIFEKLSTVIAPVIGGVLIIYFGPKVTMLSSSFLLTLATVPLFKTQGLAKKQHYFKIRGFPWAAYRANFLGQFGRGFVITANIIWPLYLILFIATNENSYSAISWVTSLQALISFLAALAIGKFLDRNGVDQGSFFKWSIVVYSAIILLRIFINQTEGVALFSILFGVSSMAYYIPFLKAQFDSADKSGSRVVYEMALQFSFVFFSFFSVIVFLILIKTVELQLAFKIFFALTAVLFWFSFSRSDFSMFRIKKK